MDDAIKYGKSFKSMRAFYLKGLQPKRIGIGVNGFISGESRSVVFLHELDLVSAAAAKANQELRDVPKDQVQHGFAGTGTIVWLEVSATGENNMRSISQKYTQELPHLVLQLGGKTFQPTTKQLNKVESGGGFVYVGSDDLDRRKLSLVIEYSFDIPEAEIKQEAEIVLIDLKGRQVRKKVDLSKAMIPAYAWK